MHVVHWLQIPQAQGSAPITTVSGKSYSRHLGQNFRVPGRVGFELVPTCGLPTLEVTEGLAPRTVSEALDRIAPLEKS